MKKHLLTSILSVAMLTVLTGCFGDKKEDTTIVVAEPSMPTTDEVMAADEATADMEEAAAPVEEAK